MYKSSFESVYEIFYPGSVSVPVPYRLVLDSPHSGRVYPPDFHYECDDLDLINAEDRYVDRLLVPLADRIGGAVLCALFPRVYIDPNRAEDDHDPDLLSEPWPEPYEVSRRAREGIGLIRRMINRGELLSSRKLSVDEVRRRIAHYYRPYHAALAGLIEGAQPLAGGCGIIHLNCHSMPPSRFRRADFVLGDRNGTSCAPEVTRIMKRALEAHGFRVAVNDPYKGVEIVRRYGCPQAGIHSLQIEMSKDLYLSQRQGKIRRGWKGFRETFAEVLILFISEMKRAQ